MTSETIRRLMNLGLNQYEAQAYVGLVANPGTSGYEIAKTSDVPRSKIYEVLDSLARKGWATRGLVDGKETYNPFDFDQRVDDFLKTIQDDAVVISDDLSRMAQSSPVDVVEILTDRKAIIASAKRTIRESKEILLLSGKSNYLESLQAEISDASKRGVSVYLISHGDISILDAAVFRHSSIDAENRWAFAPVVIVVADHSIAVAGAETSNGDIEAMSTRNKVVATMIAEYVKHDIHVAYLTDEDARKHHHHSIQAMWFRNSRNEEES